MTTSRPRLRYGGRQAAWREPCAPAKLIAAALLAVAAASSAAQDNVFTLLTDVSEIRERAEQLTPEEKHALVKKREGFARLTAEQQSRLRSLHHDLSIAEDGPLLFDVMTRYQQWLKALPSSERAELLELPATERIARIREIKERQERERFHQQVASVLTADDANVVLRWIEGYVRRHEDELITQLPAGIRPEPGSEFSRRTRRGLMYAVGRPGSKVKLPLPTRDEFAELANQLSPGSRVKLDEAKDEKAQLDLVREWMHAAARIRFRGPEISKERLQKFYNEELTAEDRQRVEKLPVRQMQDELRRKYFEYHPDSRRGFGWGRGPSGRGGDRRGPPRPPRK